MAEWLKAPVRKGVDSNPAAVSSAYELELCQGVRLKGVKYEHGSQRFHFLVLLISHATLLLRAQGSSATKDKRARKDTADLRASIEIENQRVRKDIALINLNML